MIEHKKIPLEVTASIAKSLVTSVTLLMSEISSELAISGVNQVVEAVRDKMKNSIISPPSHYDSVERIVGQGELIDRHFPHLQSDERLLVAETILSEIGSAEREKRYLSRRPDKLRTEAILRINSLTTPTDTEISHNIVEIVLEFFARHGYVLDESREGYAINHPDRELNLALHVIPALDLMTYFKFKS